MIFPTGRHHGQDVVLATPSATLRPTQGLSLHQHAMGDTALACFGRIPWIDRQGVRRARQQQSNNADDDGNDGEGPQPAARGSPPPPTPGGVNDNNHGNLGVPGGRSSFVRRAARSSPRLVRMASRLTRHVERGWGGGALAARSPTPPPPTTTTTVTLATSTSEA